MNPLEIVARTPKNNCGECGFPTCLAFAAAVCATGIDLQKCPHIDSDGLEVEIAGVELEDASRQRDLALVEHLQSKIAGVDFQTLIPRLGAVPVKNQPDAMSFFYLGQNVELSKTGIQLNGNEPEDPRDQILLYNYVFSGGGREPENEWIGMESMPNSISKVRTLFSYCEEPIARLFTGRQPRDLADGIARAGGQGVVDETADLAVQFQVLPKIPQKILFWDEEPEEGFEAKAKILYDHNALDFLDIESLLFSSERLAERLVSLIQ
jgi:hypothetical protein